MKLDWKKTSYYFGIVLGVLLFLHQVWLAIRAIQEKTVISYNVFYLIAALGMIMLAYLLQTLAWKQIMQGQNIALGAMIAFQSFSISLLPRYIPGTIWGYLSRSEWLKENYRIPRSKSNIGSMLEVILAVLTASVVVVSYYGWSTFSGGKRLLVVIGIFVVPWLLWYGFKRITTIVSIPLPDDAQLSLIPFYWFKSYLVYLAVWVCHGVSLMWLMHAIGIQFNGDILSAVYVTTTAWLAGFAVLFVPSGLGVREYVLSTLLAAKSPALMSLSVVSVTSRLLIYATESIWFILGYGLSLADRHKNDVSLTLE